MSFTVTGAKPAVLSPVYTHDPSGPFDPEPAMEHVLAEPLRSQINLGAPARILEDGNDITGDLLGVITPAFLGDSDPQATARAKDLLGSTMLHYDASLTLPISELFASQAAHSLGLPEPSPRAVYAAGNAVIPAAKELLAGVSGPDQLLVGLDFAYHPAALGAWFTTPDAFDRFTGFVAGRVSSLPSLPAETTRLLTQFQGLSLEDTLTESLLLRTSASTGNDEYSFPRVLVMLLMGYMATNPADAGLLPFDLRQLFNPSALVLVNVEAHAHADPADVTDEWRSIKTSLLTPPTVISLGALTKLTAMQRNASLALRVSGGSGRARSGKVVFKTHMPTGVDLAKAVTRVMRRMRRVNMSQNVLRTSRTSFLRASRRDPDNPNRPGKIVSQTYLPDIHIYADTSGSISEEDYRSAVTMLIGLAKKLDVNLYFNSFSHILSAPVRIDTRGKSVAQVWKRFSRVPKVTGGTEFEQVWSYIEASPHRRRELSIIITDFAWYPPARRVDHPKNLYYAPCTAYDWEYTKGEITHFAESMKHIEPRIESRILGVYA